MNPAQHDKPKSKRTSKKDKQARPSTAPRDDDDQQSAAETRQSSQTAQDRDHTIRRGDAVTTQTKEFPT